MIDDCFPTIVHENSIPLAQAEAYTTLASSLANASQLVIQQRRMLNQRG